MFRLYQKNEIGHFAAWFGIYLAFHLTINLLAEGRGPVFMVAGVPFFLLGLACFVYLTRTGIAHHLGLNFRPHEKAPVMLFYLPMLILPLLNLRYGLRHDLGAREVLFLFLTCAGIDFLEEVIFRGLLLEALGRKWKHGVTFAIVVGTFGLGHMLSMQALGHTGGSLFMQILNALAVGLMFLAVMIATENHGIATVFHIGYTFISSLTHVDAGHPEVIFLTFAITLLYSAWLFRRCDHLKEWLGLQALAVRIRS